MLAVLSFAAVVAVGCASTGTGSVHGWAMAARLRQVEVGQSIDAAHLILGRDPVRKPGHPKDPFPSPTMALDWETPKGQAARVELYVIAARAAKGCPDVHYEDVPVAYLDGVVVGTSWEFVEWSWRSWGGSLHRLREIQDSYRCVEPPLLEAS